MCISGLADFGLVFQRYWIWYFNGLGEWGVTMDYVMFWVFRRIGLLH